MALDVGDVRIGVALSDETETLASGLVTLKSVGPRKDAQALAALAREHDVGEIVVGLPLRLDGSLGSQAEKVVAFVERLRRVLRLPVVTRDERLTSVEADERLAEAGVRRRDRKARIDQAAAALILQEHLDERKASSAAAGRRRSPRDAADRSRGPAALGGGAGRVASPCRSWRSWPSPAGPSRRGGTRRRSRRSPRAPSPCGWSCPRGRAPRRIARQLHALGLVRHPLVFRVLAQVRGVGARLKAGEYSLSGPLSLEGILDALSRGDVVRRDLTIPEGRSLDEIAALVAAEGLGRDAFLEAARDPPPCATSTPRPRTSRATSSRTPTTFRRCRRPRGRSCGA